MKTPGGPQSQYSSLSEETTPLHKKLKEGRKQEKKKKLRKSGLLELSLFD